MSDPIETTGHTESPVRSTTSVLLLLAGLVVLPVIVLATIFCLRGGVGSSGGTGAGFADAVRDDRIQAVYMASDEVFFGTITDADGDVFVLEDAFFLRRAEAAADSKDAEGSLNLVSVAQDVGGDGNLVINAREVVRVQNLTADADIAQSIEDSIK